MIDVNTQPDMDFVYIFLQALINEHFPKFSPTESFEVRQRWIDSYSKIVSYGADTPPRIIQ